MQTTRRTLLATGAVVAAAAASGALSEQHRQPVEVPRAREPSGKFYANGEVCIHYEDLGRGFPLLIIPGGGLNSTMPKLAQPFDPRVEFTDEYRCITSDLRNAMGGQSE